jgi:hypothetical protein
MLGRLGCPWVSALTLAFGLAFGKFFGPEPAFDLSESLPLAIQSNQLIHISLLIYLYVYLSSLY